jgi:hypothetical protein
MKTLKLFLTIVLSLSLSSCAELKGDSTGANDIIFDTLIGGTGAVSVGGDQNGGAQRFLLDGQAPNVNTGANFKLNFRLPEKQSLTFHLYSFSDLTGGVNVNFSRNDGKLTMTMSLNTVSHSREIKEFENIEEVDITIDIHNDHPNAHNLMWKTSGPFGDAEECEFDGDCLYNTETFALDDDFNPLWSNAGKASGTFWGYTGDPNLIISLSGFLDALSNV